MGRGLPRPLTLALAVTAAASGLLLASTSGADAAVDKSIAGIELDFTAADVKRSLGEPDARIGAESPFGRTVKYRYRAEHLTVSMERASKRVFSVFTRSAAERTDTGVGVGSTEDELRDGLSEEQCGERRGRLHYCLTSPTSGSQSIFRLRRGRVSSVELRKVAFEV